MFNFYLIIFYLKYFPGNIFTNSICFAAADLLSYTISSFIVRKTTTTKALVLAYTISLIGAGLYLVCHHVDPLIPVLVILSRVGNSMSFNTIYVTNNRLFPVTLMATSFGFAED